MIDRYLYFEKNKGNRVLITSLAFFLLIAISFCFFFCDKCVFYLLCSHSASYSQFESCECVLRLWASLFLPLIFPLHSASSFSHHLNISLLYCLPISILHKNKAFIVIYWRADTIVATNRQSHFNSSSILFLQLADVVRLGNKSKINLISHPKC